ncbi:hypothetical protein PVAG01_07492 [Phlyctema vagabunda]|uniref:Uncharacterized protein n=1 Tax=Phlyctema vagabunda TaxID=108571 RepID=A0ABR4PCJ9_9HELO
MSLLGSSSGSPSSFHTAPRSPEPMSIEDIWPGPRQRPPEMAKYRSATQLPRELRVQCGIYLNERLYPAGLALLTNLLTAGGSSPESTLPSFVPTPLQIEFISTLTVHPFNTMKALPEDNQEVASAALTLLRTLLSTVGPINARLGEALDFTTKNRMTRRGRQAAYDSDDASSDSEDERATMNNALAGKESLRYRAVDFWHAVGWAFNCSIRYPDRWRYWKTWLGFMLDVLDADWEAREKLDIDAHDLRKATSLEAEMQQEALQDSILIRYLSEARGRSAGVRRIIKSVFADGCHDALRSFPAVFDSEVRSSHKRKRTEDVVVHHKLNLHDDEDDMFTSSQPAEEVDEDMTEEEMERLSFLGGIESIHLRQRFLGLLSRLAVTLPASFDSGKEVYKIYVDHLKILPIQAFSLFVSPSMNYCFIPEVFCSLDQMLLLRMLPSNVPKSRSKNDDISQELMERRYLPYCASTNSVEDNAKYSILIESLMRLFVTAGCPLDHTPELVDAVEKGIAAREAKLLTRPDRRRKVPVVNRENAAEALLLKASSARLRALVAWAEEGKT